MTQNPGKPACPADLRALDLFEFAQSRRQAAGGVRVSQLPRMLNEVPADAPDRDTVFSWQAEGSMQPELQDDGTEAPQPYLRLAVHGSVWIECQRCLSPYSQHLDVDATYRIVTTEDEADEFPLDNDEVEVIVGSRQFDLIDLIEEELLLSLTRGTSIFKRGMKGVYQHCKEKHLHRYLAEFDHRYNYRVKLGYSDIDRTLITIRGVAGKRLMYRQPR